MILDLSSSSPFINFQEFFFFLKGNSFINFIVTFCVWATKSCWLETWSSSCLAWVWWRKLNHLTLLNVCPIWCCWQAYSFRKVLPVLSKAYHVIAFDWIGKSYARYVQLGSCTVMHILRWSFFLFVLFVLFNIICSIYLYILLWLFEK